jgi:hypothetical protein
MNLKQGKCCETRCFNPPHNWQLGWGTPLAQLNSSTFPAGTWLTLDLPAQHVDSQNMVLVQPDWTEGYEDLEQPHMWFLGYR